MTSPPSIKLVVSVGLTLVLGALIAVFVETFKLSGPNLGYIILFNVASLLVVDLVKIQFRKWIKEEPGATIDNDELIQPPPKRTEVEQHMNKGMRYEVHRESVLPVADRHHQVEVRSKQMSLADFFTLGDVTVNDGFTTNKQASVVMGRPVMAPTHDLGRRQKQMTAPPRMN